MMKDIIGDVDEAAMWEDIDTVAFHFCWLRTYADLVPRRLYTDRPHTYILCQELAKAGKINVVHKVWVSLQVLAYMQQIISISLQ